MNDQGLRERLLAFYDERKRDLPWRRTSDPYRIWVSEIMLQQTRVETVIPYYQRWMERFPTVSVLADAHEDEVLGLWAGLGYYSRARNLHRAAAMVRDRFGGRLPASPNELRELPGIGEYTAGAVASIAFGRVEPVVDGNVRRVLARLHDEAAPGSAWLRQRAGALVDPDRPGDFNQALMELGATVCTPRSPDCGACPWLEGCGAYAAGTVAERPAPKKATRVREETIPVEVAARRNGGGEVEVLLEKRPDSGLLAGMWAFPETVGGRSAKVGEGPATAGVPLAPVDHVFSHLRARYEPVLVIREASSDPVPPPRRWVTSNGAAELALPVAQRKILEAAMTHLNREFLGGENG